MRSFKQFKEKLEGMNYVVIGKPSKEKPNENIILMKDHEFVASVRYKKEKGGCLKFGKTLYKDVVVLLDAVQKINEKLPFPVDTYNPMIRDEYRREARIDDTLRKFGFGIDKKSFQIDKRIANGELGMVFGEIWDNRLVIGPYTWITIYDKNTKTDKELKETISSFLFSYYAANLAKMCKNLNNSGTLKKLDGITVQKFDKNTCQLTETDVTERIVGVLENALKILKKDDQ